MEIARALSGYLDGLGNLRLGFRAPSVFVPFAAFAALQCALLVLLAFFTASPIATFMIPVVQALGGEEALHYPISFVRLPATYQHLYLPLAATVGFAAWSWGVWLMVDHHLIGRTRPRRPFRSALLNVIAVGVVFVGLSTACGFGIAALAERLPRGPVSKAATLGAIAVTACLQSFLVYTPIVLRLRGGGALRAVRGSARYAAANFGATFLIVATVLVIHLPVDALLSKSDLLATRFQPEIVLYVLIGSALLEMATAYVLFAATTGLALPEEGGMK